MSLRKSTASFFAAGLFALALASGPAWAADGQNLPGHEAAGSIATSDSDVNHFLASLAATPKARPAATDYQCTEPPCETDGDGSSSCSTRCPDGSWSSIGCYDNEIAHCTCGGYPLMANPYCTRKWW